MIYRWIQTRAFWWYSLGIFWRNRYFCTFTLIEKAGKYWIIGSYFGCWYLHQIDTLNSSSISVFDTRMIKIRSYSALANRLETSFPYKTIVYSLVVLLLLGLVLTSSKIVLEVVYSRISLMNERFPWLFAFCIGP